jgi:hypothetical protein
MTSGKTLITLSTAIALGLLGGVSAVQANDNDRIGPRGQSVHRAEPAHHSSVRQGGSAYGLAPGYRSPARPNPTQGESQFEKNWFGYQDCPGTETQGGC